MCKRNNSLDIAKGLAVLLMIWGHCIQFGNGSDFLQQQGYYDDVIYRSIYSFHMPLFAIIGGYLLSCSLKKRTTKSVLSSRLKNLAIPIISWSLVNYIIEASTYGMAESIVGGLKQYFWVLMGTLWFLWAMLFCSVCVMLIHSACKDNVSVFIVVFVLNMITPDSFNLNYFKFLYPFFAAGYLWKEEDIGKRLNKLLSSRMRFAYVGGLFLIWVILLTQFKKEVFIYQSGFTLLGKGNPEKQLFIDIFRVLIGLCGSVWMLFFANCISKTILAKFLSTLGKNSLGIYIVNNYVNIYILKIFCANMKQNAAWVIALTCITMFVCLAISLLIGRNKSLNKLLLGGR